MSVSVTQVMVVIHRGVPCLCICASPCGQPCLGGVGMHKGVCVNLFLSLGHILRLASEYISKHKSSSHVHQPGTETPRGLDWPPPAGQEEPPGPGAARSSNCL